MTRREASPRPDLAQGGRSLPWLDWRRFRLTWLAYPGSALAALLVGAFMLLALGANPVTGYRALLDGAFGRQLRAERNGREGRAAAARRRGDLHRVPRERLQHRRRGPDRHGRAASRRQPRSRCPGFPAVLLIPLTILAGAVGGGAWGAIPGAFKGYFGVNEILSTIMMNLVAVQVMNYMLAGPLHDKTAESVGGLIPQTRLLPESSWLPILKGGTQLHLGVLVAVLAAVAAYVLLWRTSFGFRIRAVGLSRDAATYAGMPVARTTTLALTLSGAMCGMAGAMLVFGSISHRMVTDGSLTGFTGSAGYNGIVVALFGGLNPLWTILSSFIFAGLLVGGDAMQVVTNVPSDLIVALNGLVVVFVVSVEFLRRRPRAPRGDAARASRPSRRRRASSSPSRPGGRYERVLHGGDPDRDGRVGDPARGAVPARLARRDARAAQRRAQPRRRRDHAARRVHELLRRARDRRPAPRRARRDRRRRRVPGSRPRS